MVVQRGIEVNAAAKLGYLLILGMSIGAVVVLGVLVAPVIFHSDLYLSIPLLDRAENGRLMGEIFRRFGYWLDVMVVVIVAYESVEYKYMRIDRVALLSALVVLGSALLFSAVYIPKILAYQGMAMDGAFESLHKASEIDFKILLVALMVLMIRRMQLIVGSR